MKFLSATGNSRISDNRRFKTLEEPFSKGGRFSQNKQIGKDP